MVTDLTPPRLRGQGCGLYSLMNSGVGAPGASIGGFSSQRFGLHWTCPLEATILVPCIGVTALLVPTASPERRSPAADPRHATP